MQAIWGQIDEYTMDANKVLIRKLKKLTQGKQIQVNVTKFASFFIYINMLTKLFL